jgi:phage major head subunit gpT-like protein
MLTSTQIVAAQKVMQTIFNQSMAAMAISDPWTAMALLATEIPSTGAEEDYRWLAELPLFEEWFGDLTVEDLGEYSYTLKNRHFAASVGVDRNEIADDKWNLINPRIQGLALRAKQHRGKLIEDLVLGGTTYKAFDGIAFFSDVSGVRINDNLLAGTISAATPTIAQVEADLETVRQAMMQFKDGRGQPIGVVPTVYAVHPKLERLFRTVMRSTADPGLSHAGTYNPFAEWMKGVIPLPSATDVNDFYAFCVDYPVKPYVWQNRQEVETELVEQKLNKKLVFKGDYRGNAGLTMPVLAAKVVSAAA